MLFIELPQTGATFRLVRLEAGEILPIHPGHNVPSHIEAYGEWGARLDRGYQEFRLSRDVLLSGSLDHHFDRFFHVSFVRALREQGQGLRFARPEGNFHPQAKQQAFLRFALRHLEVPAMHCPGGLNVPLYEDELLVPAYSMSGSHGWIIRKSDLPEIRRAVPSLGATGHATRYTLCLSVRLPYDVAGHGRANRCANGEFYGSEFRIAPEGECRHSHEGAALLARFTLEVDLGNGKVNKVFTEQGVRITYASLSLGGGRYYGHWQEGDRLPAHQISRLKRGEEVHGMSN